VQIVQVLKQDYKPHRFEIAKDILSNVEADENYLRRRIFRDEATFYVRGRVNHRNCKMWGSGNPYAIREIEINIASHVRKFWGPISLRNVQ
jgi:hypothetical protein